MTLSLAQRRLANLAGFLACVAMMGYALYAERALGFEPCPLCMFQRVGVAILGAVFLLAALHDPTGRSGDPRGARAYGVLILLAAAFPAYVAGRHVYIQSLPAGSVPSCGASLDYMMDVLPLHEEFGVRADILLHFARGVHLLSQLSPEIYLDIYDQLRAD